MIWLVLGMLLAMGLAALVLATVALPARRAGRPMFTPRGAKLFRVGDGAVRPGRSKQSAAKAEKTSPGAVGPEQPVASKPPAASKKTAGSKTATAAVKKPVKERTDTR